MQRLTEAEKQRVIKYAGPHRTINFHFIRADLGIGKREKLICVGAKLER